MRGAFLPDSYKALQPAPPVLPCPDPTSLWRMQASVLLFRWGSYCWACNLLVLTIYLFFPSCYVAFCLSKARHRLGRESVSWCLETSLLKIPFPGRASLPRTELPPPSFVSFFIFYIFSYLFLKTMICFSGCLMSSSSIQKLFCEIYSALKCSFDEFVREKVVYQSYSSAILGLPVVSAFNNAFLLQASHQNTKL